MHSVHSIKPHNGLDNNEIGFGSTVTNYTSGTTGAWFKDATGLEFEQNIMDGVDSGLALSGGSIQNNDTVIFCNTFNHNHYGFTLSNSASAGKIEGKNGAASNNHWIPETGWYDGATHDRWHTYNQSQFGKNTIFFTTTADGYKNDKNGTVSAYDPIRNSSPSSDPVCTPPSREEIDHLVDDDSIQFITNPNPCEDNVFIRFLRKPAGKNSLQLHDAFGRLIYDLKLENVNYEINLSMVSLPAGMYIVTLFTKSKSYSTKIVKVK